MKWMFQMWKRYFDTLKCSTKNYALDCIPLKPVSLWMKVDIVMKEKGTIVLEMHFFLFE